MATLYEQRNLSMTPELWTKLEALAVATNSRSTRGPQARQYSWRSLIERIAAGEFTLVEKQPYQMPAGLDEAVRQVEHRQRYGADAPVPNEQHTKQAQKTPLKMQQMNMLDLEPV